MLKSLIILAGGSGLRLINSSKVPKQYISIGSNNIIEYFLENLEKNIFDIIVIVCNPKMKKKYLANLKRKFYWHNIHFTNSGNNRQESSKKGVLFLKKFKPKIILIHDAARPLIKNKLLKKLIKKLDNNQVCAPYINQNDYIKYKGNNNLIKNDLLIFIQTPQAFFYKDILYAHNKIKNINARDDTTLTEKLGIKTKLIKGDKTNIKITFKEDIDIFNLFKRKIKKNGIGYDIHKIDFYSKRKLTLCGVKINHQSLIGHSDADVGYHAICDSILGSLSLRDIGYYFKNNDKRWKNINSNIFLKFAKKRLEENNYKIINLDINFICETPNINKYVKKMKLNISNILDISKDIISIKATTNEKIGLIGKGEGIAAESIVSIENV